MRSSLTKPQELLLEVIVSRTSRENPTGKGLLDSDEERTAKQLEKLGLIETGQYPQDRRRHTQRRWTQLTELGLQNDYVQAQINALLR